MKGLLIAGALAVVARAGSSGQCTDDVCYNDIISKTTLPFAEFCYEWLDGDNECDDDIPADFPQCMDVAQVSAACSCVTASHTTTSCTTTTGSATGSVSATTTPSGSATGSQGPTGSQTGSQSVVTESQTSGSATGSQGPTGSASGSETVPTGSATGSGSASGSQGPTGSASGSETVPSGSATGSGSASGSQGPTGSASGSETVPTGSATGSGSASGSQGPTGSASGSASGSNPPVVTSTATTEVTKSGDFTTSTIYTTETRTLTKCPATVTNCPEGPYVTTVTIPISTTVCPVTKTEEWTTSTVYTTQIRTVTKCPETVTNCPAGPGPHVITETIAVSTTVCPVKPTGEVPQPPKEITKTLYTTSTFTVTKCHDNDDDCHIGKTTTTIYATGTTCITEPVKPTEPGKPVSPPTEPSKPVSPPSEPSKPVSPPAETKPAGCHGDECNKPAPSKPVVDVTTPAVVVPTKPAETPIQVTAGAGRVGFSVAAVAAGMVAFLL